MSSIQDAFSLNPNATCVGSTSNITSFSTKLDLSNDDEEFRLNQIHQEFNDPAPSIKFQFLGRYRLIRSLGEGSFGQVWLAHDEVLLRQVAIKVPKSGRFQKPEDANAYLAEARHSARLDHPHIVPVYDMGYTFGAGIYIVSKFIDGCTLRDKIKRTHFNHEESAVLVATIAEALHHAHTRHVIHRDVKPDNILVEDATGFPYLADFGLAVPVEELQKVEGISGTPAYMSPEQACGHRVDCRSDLFSLGIILYEMLTGLRPFRGDTPQVLHEIVKVDPTKPRDIDPTIPLELERISLKALSKNPAERYVTAAAFAKELSNWKVTVG